MRAQLGRRDRAVEAHDLATTWAVHPTHVQDDLHRYTLDYNRACDVGSTGRHDAQLSVGKQADDREGEAPGRVRDLEIPERCKARDIWKWVGLQGHDTARVACTGQHPLDGEGIAERHRIGGPGDL